MDVVRSTFPDVLPTALRALTRASFVAFDLEFTGIGRGFRDDQRDDPLQSEYGRARHVASQYGVAQVGLSCFELRDPAALQSGATLTPQHFRSQTFNFNVFPGTTFQCEPGALRFLRGHAFDFNKFIGEGIPYTHAFRRQRRLQSLTQKQQVPYAAAKEVVDESAGFCQVMEALFQANKPIVGHNMLFDLAFVYAHFHEPMPKTHAAFTAELSRLFPAIWDTKHLASNVLGISREAGGTSLGRLFQSCRFDTTALHSATCTRYSGLSPAAVSGETGDKTADDAAGDTADDAADDVAENTAVAAPLSFAHEAGADAFMTGCVFLDLASRTSTPQAGWLHHLDGNHADANQIFVSGSAITLSV